MELHLVPFPIIQIDVKTPGHGDDELMQRLVSVTAPFGAAGNVIEVINALDVERDVTPAFNEREIPTRIMDDREFDELALIKTV